MKKLFSVIAAILLTIGLATNVQSKVTKIDDNTIFIHDKILEVDHIDFTLATRDTLGELTIYLDTHGGSAYSTLGIIKSIQMLQEQGIVVITEVRGRAFSGGALIWSVGNERVIHSGSTLMYHHVFVMDARGEPIPEEKLDKSLKDMVDGINTEVLRILGNQFGVKFAKWLFNKEDKWIDAKEAFELNMATKYIKL